MEKVVGKVKVLVLTFLMLSLGFLIAWRVGLFGSTGETISSIVREDIIGNLLPFQSETVSTSQLGELQVSVICTRNVMSYNVSLHSTKSDNVKNVVELATKDTSQDCKQYIIEEMREQNNGTSIEILFRNSSKIEIK